MDERTLREIYLTGYEIAVKEAQPWTVMCSYNRINGTYASDNKYLMNDILKEEWGHQGLVVTDWGAMNERVEALKAGVELEMPGATEWQRCQNRRGGALRRTGRIRAGSRCRADPDADFQGPGHACTGFHL